MAVTFVAASSGTSAAGTSTSFATTLPTGWAAGDVAILIGHVSATSLTMSVGAGWAAVPGITNPTSEDAASRTYAWYRVMQAGDTAPTITNSGAMTGGWHMAAYRGADQASPIGQASTATAAAATSATLPTLTGVTADAALHAFAHASVASGTIPTGLDWNAAYTESLDVSTSRATTSANIRLAAARRLIASAGNYGGETVAVANAISSSMVVGLVEIKSAATPSTVALTPAVLAPSAVPVDPVPQPVTATPSPAALALAAVPVTPVPQPVTVAITAAEFALTAVPVDPASGLAPATAALTAATFVLTAVPVDPVPRAVNRTLTPASFTPAAVPVAATPLPVTVTPTPAVIAFAAVPAAPIPLPVTVELAAALLHLEAATADAHPAPVHAVLHGVAVRVPVHKVTVHANTSRVTWSATPASVRRTA